MTTLSDADTQERYTYRDPSDLPIIDERALAIQGAASGKWIEPPGWSRRTMRYAPEFVDDPDSVGLFSTLRAATSISPAAYVLGLNNPTIVGFRTILSGRNFFTDQAFGERPESLLINMQSPHPSRNEETRLQPTESPDQFTFSRDSKRLRHLGGETVVLCSAEPSNFGSFIFRVIPKLFAVKSLGLSHLPILVWSRYASMKRLLGICGVPEDRIIQHDPHVVTTMDRAIAPSLRNPYGLLDAETKQFYSGLRSSHGCPPGKRRIYISRLSHAKSGGSTRVMVNEEDLIQRLSAIGFEIIEPEKLPPDEQIKVFSSAEMIIGPSGSALFNAVFCHPGTKLIDIESEPDWIYAHAGLFASCQLRYGIFVGKADPSDLRPVHRNWTVNVEALVARAQAFAKA